MTVPSKVRYTVDTSPFPCLSQLGAEVRRVTLRPHVCLVFLIFTRLLCPLAQNIPTMMLCGS